jgi:putative redox protein
MPSTTAVSFPGAQGQALAGRLVRPANEPRAWALFAHCFTCGKDLRGARRISESLAERGVAVLRFDFTGLGESEGDFADGTFSGDVADLVAAADWLRREHAAPRLLVGHSLGGAAALAAAPQIPETKALATIGAPADPAHVKHLLKDAEADLAAKGEAEVVLAGRRFTLRQGFVDDLTRQRLPEGLADLRRALLVLHAPLDQVVGVDNARRLFQAAKHPKSFVSLDGADHLLSRPADAHYAGDLIAAWASRYVEDAPTAPAPVPHGAVEVHGTRARYRTDVRVGPHLLLADEPRKMGGTDLGPGPYDYLLAGLGACTSMTLRMYADRKGWPLDEVRVRLSHRKVHAKDCEDCESTTGRIEEITRELQLEGDLDAEQRERLVEIADRCPVHRTLEGEIKVRTTAVD